MHRLRCSGIFELVTFTVNFDLLLKNFNIGHNFFIVREGLRILEIHRYIHALTNLAEI